MDMGKSGYMILLLTVTVAAVSFNFLIIYLIMVNRYMWTRTNYHIVNMAAVDTLATITCSIATFKYLINGSEWKGNRLFGEYIVCKGVNYLYFISMICSMYSLVLLTYEWFMAVTHPLQHMIRSSWAKYTIPATWTVSLAIPAHLVITKIDFCHQAGSFYCTKRKSPLDAVLILSVGFILPHIAIIRLYVGIAYKLWTRRVSGENIRPEVKAQISSQRITRKVNYMIFWILIAFEVSWSPLFMGYLFPYLLFNGPEAITTAFVFKVMMISNGISNALIYIHFNQNFRRAFKQMFRGRTTILSIEELQRHQQDSGNTRPSHFINNPD